MRGQIPAWVVEQAVTRALREDIGAGDITTDAIVEAEARCRAEIIAKAEGVIAGLALARATFAALDPGLAFECAVSDGDRVKVGTAVARLAGRTAAILTGERTALNFLQRMSGIATATARYVEAVKGTNAVICDTRKTAPGLRELDKYAVRAGGGRNHRVGLYDGVLIKDNHIRAAGGVAEAVKRARRAAHHLVRIEAEVQSLDQIPEAIGAGAEALLLDNMSAADVARAVEMIAGRCQIEASGGVTLESVRALAECGVDYISVGALTHSAVALDLSLEIVGS
jgi:nicotinate-nucleotide pyrophosphorylase (carboxylating)